MAAPPIHEAVRLEMLRAIEAERDPPLEGTRPLRAASAWWTSPPGFVVGAAAVTDGELRRRREHQRKMIEGRWQKKRPQSEGGISEVFSREIG